VRTFATVFLAVGFVLGFGLFAWAALASIRRHGFRNAVRDATRAYVAELPLYWRVPIAAWLFVVALPLLAVWGIVEGEWDPVAAAFLAVLWLAYLVLLRWHFRAKARARAASLSVRGRPWPK
jgi:hypothetical protein